MKLNHSFIALLILITLIFSFTSNKPPIKKTPVATPSNQTKQNNYEVAGIDNPLEFNKTFLIIKKIVANNNKKALANYIFYPLKVNSSNNKNIIKTKEEFIAQYDTIFTPKIKTALTNQKIEDLFVNYQGVMVKDGEIWLKESNSKYGIVTINQ